MVEQVMRVLDAGAPLLSPLRLKKGSVECPGAFVRSLGRWTWCGDGWQEAEVVEDLDEDISPGSAPASSGV